MMTAAAMTWKSITLSLASAALLLSACGSQINDAGHVMSATSTGADAGHMSSGMPSMNAGGMPASGGPIGEQGDILFAQMMIPHHLQAIEMADIALASDGASPFVRDLASRIKSGQQPEIDLMTAWLEMWGAEVGSADGGNDDAHSGHDMGDMEGMDGMPGMMQPVQMSELKAASGSDFDRLWLTMMIEHHQGAITMVDSVLETTSNPEVIALANAIADAQTTEIGQMEGELGR